jgi:hypothetical protein
VALCLVALVAVAAPLAAFDPTIKTEKATLIVPQADGTTLVTTREGDRLVTIKHFPDGRETLVDSSLVTAGTASLADADDRDNGSDDEIDTIIASKAVGLTPDYIAAMRAAGFADASVDDLTGARAVGVTPEYARQMRQYDADVDLDTVIGAKATGLDPAYFTQMRQMFPGLSLDDAVGMSAVGVSPAFAQQMRQLFPRASADDIQGMAAVGVTPEYIREMRRQGLPANDPDQAIESRVLFPKSKRAAHAPPVPPVPPAAIARAVTISSPDGSRTVIGAEGLTVRSPDGSRTAIGKEGLTVRSPDGSTTVINRPPGDEDDHD